MKNLLIINTNFPPNTSIGTQRILRICKYLRQFPWNISVLTLKEEYFGEVVSPDPQLSLLASQIAIHRTGNCDIQHWLRRLRRSTRRRQSEGRAISGNITSQSTTLDARHGGKGFLTRLKAFLSGMLSFPDKDVAWLPQAVWNGLNIIRRKKIDVLFTSSPPHSTHLIGAILKMLTGCQLVVDFRDPWVRSVWKHPNNTLMAKVLHRLVIGLERWVVRTADQVICVTPELCQDFRQAYPVVNQAKFQVFYNGFDPDNVPTGDSGESQARNRVVFTHAGSLYKKRDPSPIIRAVFDLLRNKRIDRSRLMVQFVGPISQEVRHVVMLVRDLALEDVVFFLAPVGYKKSFEIMRDSDVLILLQPGTRLQVPAKLYDYLCCDKPILAIGEKGSATESIVNGKFGCLVAYEDQDGIAEAIASFYQNPQSYTQSIPRYREYFNFAKSVSRLHAILDQSPSRLHETSMT